MIRRTLTAVLAAVALVGSIGTAVAVAEPDGGSGGSAALPGFTWPPADITPVHETAAQLEVRTARFSARAIELLPQVVHRAEDVSLGVWGHEAAGLFDGQQYVTNQVRFTGPRGLDSLFVQISAPGFVTQTPAEMCGTTTCTGAFRLADGGLVVFTEYVSAQWSFRTAVNYRPNGEVMWVQAGGSSVVTNRQLARLATDGAFTFAS